MKTRQMGAGRTDINRRMDAKLTVVLEILQNHLKIGKQ
jgi:hypothetical protein